MASVGRLWSYAGLVVWFKAMWTTECKKRTIYFDVHSFHMHHKCMSYLQSEPKLEPTVSLFGFMVRAAALKCRERYRESILFS